MASFPTFEELLCKKFLKAEDELFQVNNVFGNSSAATGYIDHFSTLAKSASFAITNKFLSTEALSLVRRVASNVTSMANNLRELELRTAAVEAKRGVELEGLFSSLSLKESMYGVQAPYPTSSHRRKAGSSTKQSCNSTRILTRSASEETLVNGDPHQDNPIKTPAHVSLCYRWLKQNLSNPYPSHKVKAWIASQSNAPIETVDYWFCNVRRKIGWTRLSKAHFRGVRALTVDYAQRVLHGEQDDQVPQNIANDFVNMRSQLDRLYEAEFDISGIVYSIEERMARNNQSVEDIPCRNDTGCVGGQVVDGDEKPPQLDTAVVDSFALRNASHTSTPAQLRTVEVEKNVRRRPAKRHRSPNADDGQSRISKRLRTTPNELIMSTCQASQSPPLRASRKHCFSQSESVCLPPTKRFRGSKHKIVSRVESSQNQTCIVGTSLVASETLDQSRLSVDEEVPSAKRPRRLPGSNGAKILKQDPPAFNGAAFTGLPPRDGILSDVSLFSDVPPPVTSELSDPVQSVNLFPTDARVSTCCSEGNLATVAPTANDLFYDPTFLSVPGVLQPTVPSADTLSLSELFAIEDFAGLPAMPNFTCDGSDILPPSLDPVPSTSELFITYSPGSNEEKEQYSPTPTAVDNAQSLSSLEFDFPLELQLNPITPDPWTVPACDGALHFSVFKEMPRINNDSWNLLEDQTTMGSFDLNKNIQA